MGLKLFGAGGIDQKSNHLLRKDIDLVNSRNMMINTYNEYVKRPGTAQDTNFTYLSTDMVYIKSLNEYFQRVGNEYYIFRNGVRKYVYKFGDPTLIGTSQLSLAEYLETAIFTHEKGSNFTAKYDGRSVYAAGLPAPEFDWTGLPGNAVVPDSTGNTYLIAFYEFTDAQGNTIYGPSSIVRIEGLGFSAYSFKVKTFKNSGFYAGYMTTAVGSSQTINAANRTLTFTSVSSDLNIALSDACIGTKLVFRSTKDGQGSA